MKAPIRAAERTIRLLTVVCVGLVVLQLWLKWSESSVAYAGVPLRVGERLEMPVMSGTLADVSTVSDVQAGTCRYVVVASAVCPFSHRLAGEWTITGLNDSDGTSMPVGWETFWVIVEDAESSQEFFDDAFPSEVWYADTDVKSWTSIGVRGVPFHLVLNREGLVVDGGPGGHLYPLDAYLPDCTINSAGGMPVDSAMTLIGTGLDKTRVN